MPKLECFEKFKKLAPDLHKHLVEKSGVDYDGGGEGRDAYLDAAKQLQQETLNSIADVYKQAGGGGEGTPPASQQPVATEGGGDMTGITHEQTEATRQRFSLPEYEKSAETVEGWDAEADRLIREGYNIEKLLGKMEKGEMPSAIEQRIMLKYIASLEAQVERNPSDEKLSELQRALQASDKAGGSEVGKSLKARQGNTMRDDSLASFFIREMEESGVDKLTDEQKAKVQKEYDDIKKANDDLQAKVEQLQEENAKLKAQENISKESRRERKSRKSSEEFAEERKQIIDDIRAKLKKARGETQATIVPYAKELFAIAPDVAKLVRNLVDNGVTKLADVVENVYDVLKDEISGLTPKDIQDIIAGEYNEKKPTRNQLSANLRDLRDEAKLINRLAELESGKEPETEKKKIERNREIADLKRQIKDHDITKISDAKNRIKQQIGKIEKQLESGDFSTPKKEDKLKLDKEGLELQDKLIKLKQDREIRILKQRYENRSKYEKGRDKVLDVLNVPRTIMASMDFSAPLRQGIVASISHPRTAALAAQRMFQSAFSQKNFDRWFYELKESPRYDLMKETKLGIADPHSPFLTAKEEAYMNNMAEKIPIVGKLIKGSERAYVMYLNKMRVDLFNRFADRFEEQGKTYENSKELYDKMAGYVNNQTGRGNLGKLEEYAPIFNTLLFSPRLMASRINLLNPYYFDKLPKELKVMYAKDMAKFIGLGITVLGLAKLAGGGDDEDKITVEDDPRSSDFGKIKQGDTRWDIWGGFQPYIRVLAQVITGERKSSNTGNVQELDGKGAFGTDRTDIVKRFIRGKLAPVPAIAVNFFSGETATGEKVTVAQQAEQALTPLLYSSLKESVKEKGVEALFTVGIPNVFGVGTQTYKPTPFKSNITIYGKDKDGKPIKREATQEEAMKYEKLKAEKALKFLEKYQKEGVYIDRYGDVTLSRDRKGKTIKYEDATPDQLKKLDSEIRSKAGREVKDELNWEKP